MITEIALSDLVSCVFRFPRLGGRAVSGIPVTWLIFWWWFVQTPGTIHLCRFTIGGLIPLGLVEDVLVGWFGWVAILPHEPGEHVFLAPTGACPVGWVLLSLGWVC